MIWIFLLGVWAGAVLMYWSLCIIEACANKVNKNE
jgi:hypothetical protein